MVPPVAVPVVRVCVVVVVRFCVRTPRTHYVHIQCNDLVLSRNPNGNVE